MFYESGKTIGIRNDHKNKLRMQLSALQSAQCIQDLNLPRYRLHSLKGNKKYWWSIRVNKNWRLTFEFSNGNVYDLDYEDYH